MNILSTHRRSIAYAAHFILVLLALFALLRLALTPTLVFEDHHLAQVSHEWSPPPLMVMLSLVGVALMAFAPLEPLLGILIYMSISYGFPRDESYYFFCRWHILEALTLLSVSGLVVSRTSRLPGVSVDRDGVAVDSLLRHPLFWLVSALVVWIFLTSAVATMRSNYLPAYNHHPIHMCDAWCIVVVTALCLSTPTKWWWLGITLGATLGLRTWLKPEYIYLNGDLGVLLSMGVCLAGLSTSAARHWALKTCAIVLVIGQLFVLYKTHNRGGLVAILVSLGIIWLTSRWKWQLLLLGAPVALIATILFTHTESWKRVQSIWTGGPDHGSVASRFVIYETGWKMTLDNPTFGVGLGGFENRMPEYNRGKKADSPHNNIIGMLAEAGFIGGVFYTALFGFAILLCCYVAMSCAEEPRRSIAGWLGAALTAYMVGGMFMTRHTLELAYLLIGGAIAISSASNAETCKISDASDLPTLS